MRKFTEDESFEEDETDRLMELLSPEAFEDPCIMLRELTMLSKEKASEEPIEETALKEVFFEKIQDMRMSYSYKPLLIKAMLNYADEENGTCPMEDIILYFREFYAKRRSKGLFVEKENSIFSQERFCDKDARRIILIYPYRRFANFQLLYYEAADQRIGFHPYLWKSLSREEKEEIKTLCDSALDRYYRRFHGKVQEDE